MKINGVNWFIIKHSDTEYHIGIVLKSDEINTTYSNISNWSNTIKTFATDKLEIIPLSDFAKCVEDIDKYYESEIKNLNHQIRDMNKDNYADEIVEIYSKLKSQIISTAQHMIESKDIFDFENKLKAICDLKRQFYSIKCETIDEDRKFNGDIKWKIKKKREEWDKKIKDLTDNYKQVMSFM